MAHRLPWDPVQVSSWTSLRAPLERSSWFPKRCPGPRDPLVSWVLLESSVPCCWWLLGARGQRCQDPNPRVSRLSSREPCWIDGRALERSSGVAALMLLGLLDVSRRCSFTVLKILPCVVAGGGVCECCKTEMAAEMSRYLLAKLPTLPESLGEKFDVK